MTSQALRRPTYAPEQYPTQPGQYWGRRILANGWSGDFIVDGWPQRLTVVEGVPNERNHRLLVDTAGQHPRYHGLGMYEWGEPTPEEMAMMKNFMEMLRNQRSEPGFLTPPATSSPAYSRTDLPIRD